MPFNYPKNRKTDRKKANESKNMQLNGFIKPLSMLTTLSLSEIHQLTFYGNYGETTYWKSSTVDTVLVLVSDCMLAHRKDTLSWLIAAGWRGNQSCWAVGSRHTPQNVGFATSRLQFGVHANFWCTFAFYKEEIQFGLASGWELTNLLEPLVQKRYSHRIVIFSN